MPHPLSSTIAVLLVAAASGYAQSPAAPNATASTVSLLDEVVVTATGSEQSVFDTPYTAHVVGREDFIDRRNVRSLPDALAETPGVLVQRTGPGQSSPFIRGFTGFRTLILIDGIRLNNAVFREGPNQYFATIDPLTVDRLDVLKGPSSVLYGSDAVGGTINVITRTPEMLPWPVAPLGKDGKATAAPNKNPVPGDVLFHPGAYYRYASGENSHSERAEFSLGLTPKLGILGGVSRRDFGDMRGGSTIGNQPNTGYSEIDGDIKLLLRPNADIDITAAFYRVEQNNVPRTHSTIYAKSFDGTQVGSDFRRDLDQIHELTYLQVEVREPVSFVDKVNLSLSWHRQREEQDRIKSNLSREITGFQDDQFGFLISAVSTTALGVISYGAEFYHDAVDSWGSKWNATGSLNQILSRGPVSNGGSYDQLGLYVQDEFKLAEPLTVTLGARYSWAEARGGMVDPDLEDGAGFGAIDKTWDALTTSLRFRFDMAKNWNFFGGVSQGFRAPNLSDLTAFDVARSGEREVPAPDLDSEHFVSFEIGSKAHFDKLGLSVYGAFFRTLIDNEIIRYETGRFVAGDPVVSKANVGDGYVQGVELGGEWRLPYGFNMFGNLSWTEGETDTYVGKHITARPGSRIQPLSGLIGLRWTAENRKFWIEAVAQLTRHQDRLSPGDMNDLQRIPPNGTRGSQVYTVRAGWQPCETVQIFAAVENIGNEDYRALGSGTNEVGTNVVLGTKIRF